MRNSTRKIIVVGGGIGGLSSTYFYLKSNPNADIALYESTDRVGGKINTPELEGLHINLGAAMILKSYTTTQMLLKDLGISVSYKKKKQKTIYFETSSHKYRSLSDVRNLLYIPSLLKLKLNLKNEDSIPEAVALSAFLQSYLNSQSVGFHMINSFVRSFGYPDLSEIETALGYPVLQELIQGGLAVCSFSSGGIRTISEILHNKIEELGGKVYVNTKVVSIDNKDQSISLSNGEKVQYDKIIIATEFNGFHEHVTDVEDSFGMYSSLHTLVLKGNFPSQNPKNWGTIIPHMDFSKDLTTILINRPNTDEMSQNHDYLVVYVQQNVAEDFSSSQIEAYLKQDLEKRFRESIDMEVIKHLYWEKAIPKPSVDVTSKIDTQQGKNNQYYVGDYSGISSVENSVKQALDVVNSINLKTT